MPLSRRCSRVARSSSVKPRTREPVRWNRKPSSSDHVPYSSHPRAFIFAFIVPGAGSYPAWTRPPLAFDAPSAMSSVASMRHIVLSYRASCRAMAQPVMPAPTMAMSYLASMVPLPSEHRARVCGLAAGAFYRQSVNKQCYACRFSSPGPIGRAGGLVRKRPRHRAGAYVDGPAVSLTCVDVGRFR